MRITMLGTGTSMPDAERVQSGILIETSDTKVLADVGSGVLHRLTQLKFNFKELDAVFISHFHVDHCSDFLTLCQTLWLAGYEKQLTVYGPPMISEWMRTLYENMFLYLAEKLDVKTRILSPDERVTIGDLVMMNTPTIHSTMDTRAMKFTDGESTLVFSSDTAPSENVSKLAKSADILIHECNWLDGDHTEGVHTSPSEVAAIAATASPGLVVLNHVSPEVAANEGKVLSIVSSETDAKVIMAKDLMVLNET